MLEAPLSLSIVQLNLRNACLYQPFPEIHGRHATYLGARCPKGSSGRLSKRDACADMVCQSGQVTQRQAWRHGRACLCQAGVVVQVPGLQAHVLQGAPLVARLGPAQHLSLCRCLSRTAAGTSPTASSALLSELPL